MKSCIAYLDCRVIASIEVGDQIFFLGEVMESEILKDVEPLVFNREDFWEVKDLSSSLGISNE